MHARSCAGAESAQRITFGVIIAFAAAYLALSGGCPANEPVDLSNPLELQGDGLLADGIDPLGGEAGEPFAFDYEIATIQNQPVALSLTAEGLSDLNWDFSIVSEPAHGSVSQIRWVDQNTAEVTYSPEQDFVGQAQFSYQVSSGDVRSNVATVIITVYPEVRFDVEVIAEQPHLTVLAYAFTRTGEELPEGTYAWQFDDYQDSGPVATHSAREYAFTSGGTHVITLTLTLAGLAAPISCSTGLSGGEKEFRMSSSDQGGVLVVSPADEFESSGAQGGPFDPGSKSYVLTNTGTEALEWSASKAQSWVSLSQISGTLAPGDSATVVASINDNANDLDPGSYTDTVTFLNKTNGDGDTTRGVSLTVNGSRGGALEVSPSDGLSSSGYQGGPFSPDSKTYTLTNTGDEPIAWSASNLEDWVSLSSAGGSLPPGESGTVVVSINDNASSLSPGSYSDTVHFTNHTNGVGSTTRGVSLTVNTPPEPGMLVVSPNEGFESSGPEGGPFDPPSAEYVLANVGDEPIEWEATHSELWLDLLPDSGSLEPGESVTVVVSIGDGSRALAPGEYNDQVEFVNITNGIGDTSRAVVLTVNPTDGSLFVLPVGGFSSSGTEGGPFTPESQPYTLANVGGLPIEWTASRTQNWITLAPTSGTLSPGASVDVVVSINANADALSPGVYSDTVSFANMTNGSGDTERAVLLTVTATDDLVISGRVTDSGGAALSGVTINGLPGDPVTNASGDYSAIVDYGFSGTAAPSRDGYDFSPASRTYDNIAANQLNQDYVGTLQTFTISGRVTDADGAAISDVTINGLPGDPVTNTSGDYSATVPYGFGGTAVPSRDGYTFSPAGRPYINVAADQLNQDYIGTLQTFTISGRVTDGEGTGIVDVRINGLPGDPVTNSSGDYSATVDYGFSGTATPSKEGYTFSPASRSYNNVDQDRSGQNYTGTEAGTAFPMTTASRITGVAPLAVFFDAVDTSDPPWTSLVVQPPDADYASYHYEWDFGDPDSGNWSTGRQNPDGTYPSKNEATGYVAAHVYESAGTYTVRLSVTDTADQVHEYVQEIEVLAEPPGGWTTYYVSSSHPNRSDANPGTDPDFPLETFAAGMGKTSQSGVQVLFKRGDSWMVSSGATISADGPGLVGAYGTGSAPDIELHTPPPWASLINISGIDWRVLDLSLTGPAVDAEGPTGVGPNRAYATLLRLAVNGFRVGVGTSATSAKCDVLLQDCEIYNTKINNIYLGGRRVGILGCMVRDCNVSHLIRLWHSSKCVYANNDVLRPGNHDAFKVHSVIPDSRYAVLTDNYVIGDTYGIAIGPQNNVTDERIYGLLVARNVVQAHQQAIRFHAHDSAIVNNVCLGIDGEVPANLLGINVVNNGTGPDPTDVVVANNLTYSGQEALNPWGQFVGVAVNDGVRVTAYNNLASAPNWTGNPPVVVRNGIGEELTESNNLVTDTPRFVDAGNKDFRLTADSPARNTGVALSHVREDYGRNDRPAESVMDIGPWEFVQPR